MFSLQASSDEMLLLALLPHSGWVLSPQRLATHCCRWGRGSQMEQLAAYCQAMAFPVDMCRETHGCGYQGCKAAVPATCWQQTAFQCRVFAQRNASELIGDCVAVLLGRLAQFSSFARLWVQPFLHLAMQDPKNTALVLQLPKAGSQAAPLVPLKPKEVIHTLVKLQQPGILHPYPSPSCPSISW